MEFTNKTAVVTGAVTRRMVPRRRWNVVSPGSTDTAMQRQLWTDAAAGAESVIRGDLETHRLGIPLARPADPSDIADAVVFLACDRARHITMHDLRVDGGATTSP